MENSTNSEVLTFSLSFSSLHLAVIMKLWKVDSSSAFRYSLRFMHFAGHIHKTSTSNTLATKAHYLENERMIDSEHIMKESLYVVFKCFCCYNSSRTNNWELQLPPRLCLTVTTPWGNNQLCKPFGRFLHLRTV